MSSRKTTVWMSQHPFPWEIILSIALLLAFLQATGVAQGASPPLRAAGQRVVALPANVIPASYSRNGRFILAARYGLSSSLCLYDAVSLVRAHCVAVPSARPFTLTSAAWSPDGSRLAFDNDLVAHGFIWLLDTRSGALTHVGQGVGGVPRYADADPAWASDSRSLVFVRHDIVTQSEDIDRVMLATGRQTTLLRRTRDTGPVLDGRSRLALVDGGRALLYVSYSTLSGVGRLVRVELPSGAQHVFLTSGKGSPGLPSIAGVTQDGRTALVYYTALFYTGELPAPNRSVFIVVDLLAGRVRPLLRAGRGRPSFIGPLGAVLSPEGRDVAYSYDDRKGRTMLAVQNLATGVVSTLEGLKASIAVKEGDALLSGEFLISDAMFWATNRTLYIGSTLLGVGEIVTLPA